MLPETTAFGRARNKSGQKLEARLERCYPELRQKTVSSIFMYGYPAKCVQVFCSLGGCIQKFPDWPPNSSLPLGAVVSLFCD